MDVVALLGSPNSGKTTLFNWLTGNRQKVVNYPGSTVDIAVGSLVGGLSGQFTVLDAPGTYSLFPKSQDEEVACKALYDEKYNIKKVVVVIDSTQIARQVHLVRQAEEAGFNVAVALTMEDLHRREKSQLNVQALAAALGCPVVPIDGILGGGVRELVEVVNKLSPSAKSKKQLEPWPLEKLQKIFHEGEVLAEKTANKRLAVFSQTENIDRVLLHPFLGAVIFASIMVLLFSSIYWAAAPLMDAVDASFGFLVEHTKSLLGEGLFSDLMADGVIAGLGSVLVFVPQILILFIGISTLEDSGYLARAAALIDRPLQKIGLNGKAFVPILSGFACAVPAMMAARSINSKKERWIATFIIPFMTCSARLPVYALLLGFLFAGQAFKAGLAMAALYIGAIVVGAVAAGILNRVVTIKSPSFFLMELPLYRRPQIRTVLRNSFRRTQAYVTKVGPIILFLSVAIWIMSTFPNYKEADEHVRLQSSYAGQLGHMMEPIFKPMGVDWRVGVGLISAFAAREVFVSSMAVMMNVTDAGDDEDRLSQSLIEKMKAATFPDGTAIFTVASVTGLLVFFALALQCISTSGTALREMQSSRFALIQLVAMNVLAYVSAIAIFQVMK